MPSRLSSEFGKRLHTLVVARDFSWRRVALWSLLMLAGGVLLLASLTTFYLSQHGDTQRQLLQEDARLLISAQKQAIGQELRSVAHDVLLLSNQSVVHQATASNLGLANLKKDFSSIILSTGWFDQLRLLTADGIETIRVNFADGKAMVVPEHELLDKADRYYTREVRTLKQGEVYISALDLNIEHGKIELPYKPTMRFGMAIHNEEAVLTGLIIANYKAAEMLARLQQSAALVTGDLLLSDGAGNLISTPDPARLWGKISDPDHGFTLAERMPDLWLQLNDNADGVIEDSQGDIYVFSTIRLYDEIRQIPALQLMRAQREKFWKLMIRIDTTQQQLAMQPYRNTAMQWMLILSLLCLLGAVPVAVLIEHRRIDQHYVTLLHQGFAHAHEAVMITDARAHIEYVNPAFSSMSGYSLDESLGRKPQELLKSNAHPPEFYQQMWAKISAGKAWEGQVIDRRKDGSLFPAWMSITPICDRHGKIVRYMAIQRDHTEHQLLQEKLSQEKKMKSLSIAIGGIAHEFNNILGAMIGNAYLVKRQEKEAPGATAKLETIERLGEQASGMIRQLLTFIGHAETELHEHQAEKLFEHATKDCGAQLPANVQLLSFIPPIKAHIRADASQIRTIINHLFRNACDAIGKRSNGNIRVELKTAEHQIGEMVVRCICFTVQDNGGGISEEHLPLLFEPFFTTREPGSGTGLGLSSVQGMVAKHGGVIEVESEPGKGSTFSIWLPILIADESNHEDATS